MMATFPAEILTEPEVESLFSGFTQSRTNLRDKALFSVCLYAQLRCNEALDLRPCDVDLEKGQITVLNGKGGKRRVVGIPLSKTDAIRTWIKVRPESEFLFCSMRGTRLRDSHVRRTIKRLARLAGIPHRVHVHQLRHSGACYLADKKVDVRIIQKQLGHSNLATTDRYLNHLRPGKVVEAISAL